MDGGRRWTADEESYLMDKWGSYSIPAIAKKLDRSVEAIKKRALKLTTEYLALSDSGKGKGG